MRRTILFSFVFCLYNLLGATEPLPVFPEKKYVTDLNHVLSPAEVSTLDERLQSLDQDEGVQLIIVLIPTLEGQKIEDVAQLFMTRWQVGNRERDSGCLLLIATAEKESYIEVGYGLDGGIDKEASTICEKIINPYLEKGQVEKAVQKGVEAIFSAMDISYTRKGSFLTSSLFEKTSLLFCFINVFLLFLLARFSSSRYWWLSPIIGFAIGISQSIGLAIVLAALAGVMVGLCFILREWSRRSKRK